MNPIVLRKKDLPLPVVIEGDNGEVRVMEIAPAGRSKLGAFMRETNDSARDATLKLLRKK